MGYETSFKIQAKRTNDGPEFKTLLAQAKEWHAVEDRSIFNERHIARMNAAVDAYGKLTANQWESLEYIWDGQAGKFYEWREVFTRLSIAYPDFVFCVEWSGESAGDWGRAEFHKGKSRETKAVLPPLPEKWS